MSDVIDIARDGVGKPQAPLLLPAWRRDELADDDGGLRSMPHWLLFVIVGFFVVALIWAWLAQIDEIARGDGKVITTSQTQYVQNLEGGIVARILVKEGDLVKKDQVLFQLDDVRFASAYREGQQGELGLRAKVARLTAEVQGSALQMPQEVVRSAKGLADNETAVHRARIGGRRGHVGLQHVAAVQQGQVCGHRFVFGPTHHPLAHLEREPGRKPIVVTQPCACLRSVSTFARGFWARRWLPATSRCARR